MLVQYNNIFSINTPACSDLSTLHTARERKLLPLDTSVIPHKTLLRSHPKTVRESRVCVCEFVSYDVVFMRVFSLMKKTLNGQKNWNHSVIDFLLHILMASSVLSAVKIKFSRFPAAAICRGEFRRCVHGNTFKCFICRVDVKKCKMCVYVDQCVY